MNENHAGVTSITMVTITKLRLRTRETTIFGMGENRGKLSNFFLLTATPTSITPTVTLDSSSTQPTSSHTLSIPVTPTQVNDSASLQSLEQKNFIVMVTLIPLLILVIITSAMCMICCFRKKSKIEDEKPIKFQPALHSHISKSPEMVETFTETTPAPSINESIIKINKQDENIVNIPTTDPLDCKTGNVEDGYSSQALESYFAADSEEFSSDYECKTSPINLIPYFFSRFHLINHLYNNTNKSPAIIETRQLIGYL